MAIYFRIRQIYIYIYRIPVGRFDSQGYIFEWKALSQASIMMFIQVFDGLHGCWHYAQQPKCRLKTIIGHTPFDSELKSQGCNNKLISVSLDTLPHHDIGTIDCHPLFNGKFLSRESTVTWPARGNTWACSWNYTSLYISRDYKIDEIKRSMDKTEHFSKMNRTGRQTSLSQSVSLDWIIPWAF